MTDTKSTPAPNQLAEHFYHVLMDSLFDAVYTVDNQARLTYWNASCTRITGYTTDEMIGQNYHNTLFSLVADAESGPAGQRGGIEIVLNTGMPGTWKGRIRRKNGQRVPIESHISPIRDDKNNIIGAVAVFRDISSQVALEEAHLAALQMSRRDQLTGLLNRAAISELLKVEMERSRRYHQPLSLIMMDLDHFKAVNDNFGHDAGDKLLQSIGGLLSNNLRKPDAPGRWGGEEFLILTPGSDANAAAQVAERLGRYVSETSLPEVPSPVSASFGVSQADPGQSADQLLYIADMALYQAKDRGRNQTVIGHPDQPPPSAGSSV